MKSPVLELSIKGNILKRTTVITCVGVLKPIGTDRKYIIGQEGHLNQ